jgi:2-polyprenyl-3-methyl-5-hydroxy-6-metoxy-1,4-benzoquinol methylase
MTNQKIEEMLEINIEQKRYYEVASGGQTHEINSASTNIWRKLRARAFGVFAGSNLRQSIDDTHREWFGDVSQLKILDLGCGAGNPLSVELAQRAREYVAIDLSESRTAELRRKIGKVPTARVHAGDFLSEEFKERDFDVVYAMSVFHHFKHLDSFLQSVESRMAPGGRIITYDPVQIWLPIIVLRQLYRPFQTDAAWEFPFDRTSLDLIEKRFDTLAVQGILGKSKWASVVGVISPSLGARYAEAWHRDDVRTRVTPQSVRNCLQVSYHLRSRS